MCLVISILLTILSINFYMNGFIPQSIMSAVLALVLLYFMYKNISCKKGGCGVKKKSSTTDKKESSDAVSETPSDLNKDEEK